MMVVEVVCRSEDVVVGRVEVNPDAPQAKLDADAVRAMEVLDTKRAPKPDQIENGAQMRCCRCGGALWFRAADGKLFAGNPGTVLAIP